MFQSKKNIIVGRNPIAEALKQQTGIDKILLFKILSNQKINNIPSTLSHVHNVYATWRYKNHFRDKYLLR